MDEYGFIPDGTRCRSCGAVLGGHKNGTGDYDHPGENYIGCCTGLCDKCMYMSGFIVREEWDGARIISYPPDCPSHRRDRQEHIAYVDCLDCKGAGRIYVSRDFGSGGPYHRYCTTCSQRYYTEDHRQRWALLWREASSDTFQRKFAAAVLRLCKVKRWEQMPYFPWSQVETMEYDRLRAHWLAEWRAACEAVDAQIARERAELEATCRATTPATA